MKYIKLFESLSSDRRAFKNWLTKIDNNQFDEELFSLFIKHRPKLEDKNIFNYKNKESLIQSIDQVSKYVPLKKFEKDLRNWEKIGLNCDELYKDDNYVKIKSNKNNDFSAHDYFMKNPSLSGRGQTSGLNMPEKITIN